MKALGYSRHTRQQQYVYMRTKTSILCAVLVAAGVATSMAQTYSQNIVGYVNLVQSPGFRIIANPLNATNNDVSNLFQNPPPGLAIYKFNGFGYDSANFDPDNGGWSGPLVLNPGIGVRRASGNL